MIKNRHLFFVSFYAYGRARIEILTVFVFVFSVVLKVHFRRICTGSILFRYFDHDTW